MLPVKSIAGAVITCKKETIYNCVFGDILLLFKTTKYIICIICYK